ncbi:MAG: HAMP domain-containing histidine kinase [Gammaproteobacteria bacterium]|nr:HAMP domain-containing histidine kinase [Gammaproteobacteria bacterium]MDH4254919.1 HAMP domain-containing histidine kinase [Gammaproteobacteria bacterium]MDH5309896.1 HAMP domain-containing histidine kinase [Gammaproteobacteria bacterium]
MKFRRPRTLNGLILVGFGLVALPLLTAVLWALFNLDRLAEQSERLVLTGISAVEQNRLLAEQVGSLERVSRQYVVLRNRDSLALLQGDLANIEQTLDVLGPIAEQAGADPLLVSIRGDMRAAVGALGAAELTEAAAEAAIARFATVRQDVRDLTTILNRHIDDGLRALQESTRRAQEVSAWQTVALVPGTILLVLFFTLLVARPIRQIDTAISQLGKGGFAKSIEIGGPRDLERLGRQLEWLRIRLLELAQEKNRFLRHMSHELKTPLANIREGTELLMDGAVGELKPEQREVTDILRTNGLRLQHLIENLLSFSAWQTKSEVLTLADFPLRALVISVAKAQRLALKSARIQLKLDVEDFSVTADPDKMRTVLDNLLSNALKFTPTGGIITIRARDEERRFVLEFADTGPGIPEHERPRVFEAFFQGGREQGGYVGGTGIGLSVVLECVQAHGGTVELVESDEFPGAHFRIVIPQQRATQEPRMAASA